MRKRSIKRLCFIIYRISRVDMTRVPKLPPANWTSDFTWACAAGPMPGRTAKQTRDAHKSERTRVWDIEYARLARLVDENDRTDGEKLAILKVDHRGVYNNSRVGISKQLIGPPPNNWRSDLSGEERTEAWKYAAGVGKNAAAHNAARGYVRHKIRISDIRAKAEIDWTDDDRAMMEKEKALKLKGLERSRLWRENPKNRAKNKATSAVSNKAIADARLCKKRKAPEPDTPADEVDTTHKDDISVE